MKILLGTINSRKITKHSQSYLNITPFSSQNQVRSYSTTALPSPLVLGDVDKKKLQQSETINSLGAPTELDLSNSNQFWKDAVLRKKNTWAK